MKVIASLAALALAAPALAQTAPQTAPAAPTSPVTRDLNSGPPAPATYLAPAPTTVPATTAPAQPAATRPAPSPATAAPSTARPIAAPATTPLRPAASAPTTSAPAAAHPAAPRPTTAAPTATTPRPAASAPATTRPAAAPATAAPAPARPAATAPATAAPAATVPTTEAAPPAPPPPSYTVLDAPARTALPFTLDLPAGFMIDAERSGPDFKMYAVRRNGAPFVMIYAGPSSQFPIYDGELVQAAGRSSMVVTEDGQRHAMEHLFQRSTAPQEIHIWVASLEGADRTLAERIAQSVDVR